MPKLILKFENRVLQELTLGPVGLRIGRFPDNGLVIDNAAVSGRHARIAKDGDHYVVEDLQSTNGTFLNEKKLTTREPLRDGDSVLVGKHTIVFVAAGEELSDAGEGKPEVPSDYRGTVMLDTERHKALLAKSGLEQKGPRTHMLLVLAGRAPRTEYELGQQTAIIGRDRNALIRVGGWFSPKAIVAISRRADKHTVTRLAGKPQVNGQPLTGRHELNHGDVISVKDLELEFRERS